MVGTVNWRWYLRLIWSLLVKVCHVHCCPLLQFRVKMSFSYVKKTDEPSGDGDILGPSTIILGSLAAKNWNKKLLRMSKNRKKNTKCSYFFNCSILFGKFWWIHHLISDKHINRMEKLIVFLKGTLDTTFLQIFHLNNWISANILCK